MEKFREPILWRFSRKPKNEKAVNWESGNRINIVLALMQGTVDDFKLDRKEKQRIEYALGAYYGWRNC